MTPASASRPSLPARWLPDAYQKLIVRLFFGLVLGLGMWVVSDYGSFIDEDTCRASGQISIVYLYSFFPSAWLPARAAATLASAATTNLANYVDRDYGVAFELPMTVLEKLSGYTTMHDVILLRHVCVFLVCFAGIIAFYWLATQRLGSWRIGLVGALLLLLSPRQFADFFYNSKDAVFLACYLAATATAVAFIKRPTLAVAIWHALACAVAIDVRIMGVLLPVLTGGLVGVRAVHGDYHRQRTILPVVLYVGLLPLFVVALWPYLWTDPVAHFRETFLNMSHFGWSAPTLHQGQIISAGTPPPWSYAAVWIGITTPLLYLAGLLLSFGLLLWQLGRRRWRLAATDGEWQDLLLWSLGLGPLVAVAALHSMLYDGWRQLYFVYPPLLLLALRGLVAGWRWQPPWPVLRRGWSSAVALVLAAALGHIASQMVHLHPLENLYFNTFAGSHPELRYEYDYWGLSMRQGLQWIAEHDTRPLIRVRSNLIVTDILNGCLLPPDERARLVILRRFQTETPDYFITTYRFHPQPYPFGPPVYSLRVGEEGRRVLDIFRLP